MAAEYMLQHENTVVLEQRNIPSVQTKPAKLVVDLLQVAALQGLKVAQESRRRHYRNEERRRQSEAPAPKGGPQLYIVTVLKQSSYVVQYCTSSTDRSGGLYA